MKGKFFALGAAVLLAFALVMAGCPADSEGAPDTVQRLISGTYNGMQFVISQILPGSKSLVDDDLEKAEGLLKDGANRHKLKGRYDQKSGQFSLSGASEDAGFQIDGFYFGGKPHGKGYDRKKQGGQWNENREDIVFDDNIDIQGGGNVADAIGLPAKWEGMWDYCSEVNAQAVEPWYTTWNYEGEFCLVITPYGIAMWIDLPALQAEITEYFDQYTDFTQQQKDQYIEEQLEIFRSMIYDINILEVDKKNNNEYHVLVSVIPPPSYSMGGSETVFRKIRFKDSADGGLEADLAYIPYEAEGFYGMFATTNIDEARAAEFVETPYGDEEYYITSLFKMKRFFL